MAGIGETMKPGNIYENIMMPGVYIRVDRITRQTTTGIYAVVSWIRRDDITKKLVDMDVQQEMFVPVDEIKYYRRAL